MKKTLIAIAALAATGAFAQSSVTIDGGYRIGYLKNGAAAATVTTISPDQSSGNTINFKVVEDLGGGTAAFASSQLRYDASTGAFNNQSGATGAAAGFHLASVGVRNATMGSLEAGRIGLDQMWGYSTFGSTGAHTNPIGVAGATQNGQWRYKSPAFSGFSVAFAGALKANTTGADNSSQILLNYANGPIAASYVLENVVGLAPAAATDQKVNGLGASYTASVAKFTIITGKSTNRATGVVAANGTHFGVAAPFGAVTAKVAFLKDATAAGVNKTSFGADYSLSKRTTLEGVFYKKTTDANQSMFLGVRHAF